MPADRKPVLESELRAAKEILSAAGIQLVNACDQRLVGTLPPELSEALAWAVREGVTNVIRHSRARICTIDLKEGSGFAVVTVADDGTGSPTPAELPVGGSGIRGLQERLQTLGGNCEAHGRAQGGFALTATVPTRGRE